MMNNAELEAKIAELQRRVDSLEEKEAIRDVLSKYSFDVDTNQIDKAVKYWSKNSVFVSDATGEIKTYRGREGMKSFLSYAEKHFIKGHQHLQLDYIIDLKGDRATAIGYQIITRPDGVNFTIDRAGFRYFAFEKQDGNWLIVNAISHAINDIEGCRNLIRRIENESLQGAGDMQ